LQQLAQAQAQARMDPNVSASRQWS
jgi:hypothetical protein